MSPLLVACGASSAPPPREPTTTIAAPAASQGAPSADRSGFAGRPLAPYHSDRMGLSIPLPDRLSWTIEDRDDVNEGWLVARHAATSTVLRARLFDESGVMARRECTMHAKMIGVLPRDEAAKERFETLADEPTRRPAGWDGVRWVAFEPAPSGRLRGHVVLATGHARSCLIVEILTEVASDIDSNELADRLELFASRVAGLVDVDRARAPMPGRAVAVACLVRLRR